MGVYDEEIVDAAEQIAEAGRPVTLHGKNLAPADPLRPWAGGSDETGVPVIAVMLDAVTGEGGNVLSALAEKVALIAAQGLVVDPKTATRLEDTDGKFYDVVKVRELKPGAQAILYKLELAG